MQKKDQKYTYADYLTWSDDQRWEIIEGVAYAMSPAPTVDHQRISGRLFRILANYFDDKGCEIFHPPLDVRLSAIHERENDIDTIVQPDLAVICDKNKLDDKGCIGAPDVIIEILSPSSVRNDLQRKFGLYEKYGVKEYWVVHPNDQSIEIFQLNEKGEYGKPNMFVQDDTIEVKRFPGLKIDLSLVWPV